MFFRPRVKRLIYLFLLLLPVLGAAQSTIPVKSGSPTIDQIQPRAQFKLSFGIPVVHDTTAAMVGTLDSLGLIIQIRATGVQYKRDTIAGGGHFWNPIVSGSGGITSASGAISGTASGTNLTTTLNGRVVQDSNLVYMPSKTVKGNDSSAAGPPKNLTAAQLFALMNLGTAAIVNVPSSGNASSSQAVLGSDTRLSDARDAKSLQTIPISATPPVDGQVLQYSSGSGQYAPTTPSSGSGTVNTSNSVTGNGTSLSPVQLVNDISSGVLKAYGFDAGGARGFMTLGTAAFVDKPVSGNASSTQVVMGNDSRLGTGFANPMTTPNDIIIGGSSGTPQRLAAGGTNTVFHGNGSYGTVANADMTNMSAGGFKGATGSGGVQDLTAAQAISIIHPREFWLKPSGIPDNALLQAGSTVFGTDGTSAIQAILDNAANGPIIVHWDTHTSITQLLIWSNTTIDFSPGCGAIERSSANVNMFTNKHPSITGTSTDKNIRFTGNGWIINGNGGNQSHNTVANGWVTPIKLIGVDSVTLMGGMMVNPASFHTWFMLCNYVKVQDMVFDWSSAYNSSYFATHDILHFNGGNYIDIINVQGVAFDDFVALNADDGFESTDNTQLLWDPYAGHGPITHVHVLHQTFLPGSRFGNRILSRTSKVDDIIFEDVSGTTDIQAFIIDNWPDGTPSPGAGDTGQVYNVTLRDFHLEVVNVSYGHSYKNDYINIGCRAKHIKIDGLLRQDFSYPGYPTLRIDAAAVIDWLEIKDYVHQYGAMTDTIAMIQNYGKVNNLFIDGLYNKTTRLANNSILRQEPGSSVTYLQMHHVYLDSVRSAIDLQYGGLKYVNATNVVHMNSPNAFLYNGSGSTISQVTFSNFRADSLVQNAGTISLKTGDAFGTSGGGGGTSYTSPNSTLTIGTNTIDFNLSHGNTWAVDQSMGNGIGQIFGTSASGGNVKLYNTSSGTNYGTLSLYPVSTTSSPSINLIPHGTGHGSGIQADLQIFNTDIVSDGTNWEDWLFRSTGTNGYGIGSLKSGTGSLRAIWIDATGSFSQGTSNLLFNTNGSLKAPHYGSGTNTGTATQCAAFDASGNLIEVACGGTSSFTSPNSTLIFGTNTGDINLSHANTWAADVTLGNTFGTVYSSSNSGSNFRFFNNSSSINYATMTGYPSGTNSSPSISLVPHGSGNGSSVKSDIQLFNTDFIADGTNYEDWLFRSTGSTGYGIGALKGGTGSLRSIWIDATGNFSNSAGNAIFNTAGTVSLPSLKSGATAPTTSGTTNMVVADANGLLSFQAIPSGSGLADPGSNGIVKRTALNTTAVAAFADLPGIASGTYTPTLTASANCSSLTLAQASYSRSGNIIHVNISGSFTATSSGAVTSITVSLPSGLNTSYTSGTWVGSGTFTPPVISGSFPAMAAYVMVTGSTTAQISTFYTGGTTANSSNFMVQFDYSL